GTLGRGQVLNVVLEVSVLDFAWCLIEFPGEREPLGYVLCMNLQQGNFTSQPDSPVAATTLAKGEAETRVSNPTVLTDKDILNMNKARLPSEVLVTKIKSAQCNFDTSPAQLQHLKSSGVPDEVILAMVQAPSGPRVFIEPMNGFESYL